VRLKRPMRRMCGSCALSALCVEVCALSALCAIWVRLGVVFVGFWFWSAEGLQTGMVCRKKSAKRPFLKWRYADHWRLIHDFDRQSVTWLAAIQKAGIFVFHLISPVTNGTISSSSAAGWRRSRLSFGDRVIWTRASDRSSGVSKLSKLLNQEDALSAPCLCGDLRSPHAPSRGAGILRRDLISRFDVTTVCGHRVIILTSTDAFPVVGGRCTGRARRCKARQGRHGKTALTCEYLLPQ
jgi:hypothetical protein